MRFAVVTLALILIGSFNMNAEDSGKTYKHASQYLVAVLDQNLRLATGSDATLAKSSTDSKLSGGSQGIHLLHTDSGDFRVEAPVNKGMSFLAALGTKPGEVAPTFHNKWFLDSVQPGTKVLFASQCGRPGKKHPNETVRCEFWFPDPDSTTHEYATLGDFTPYIAGDASNTAKTANTLCGTGKLNAATEAQICPQTSAAPIPAPVAPPAETAAPAQAPPAATPSAQPVPTNISKQESAPVPTQGQEQAAQ